MVYNTFRARKPMDIGLAKRLPGELVPEAETFFKVEHLVHGGFIVREVVEDDVFLQAVDTYCPDLAEVLINKETV